MRRIRRADDGVDAERLRNPDPDVWLTPAERIRLVEMVDEAREVWMVDSEAETPLDTLAPAARFPARLIEDRARAIRTTEALVVAYRRSVAGWRFASSTGQSGADVAAEFGLGHVSRPGEEGRWLAEGVLVEIHEGIR